MFYFTCDRSFTANGVLHVDLVDRHRARLLLRWVTARRGYPSQVGLAIGYRTFRHQDTLRHFGTDLKTLRHQKRGTDSSTRVP